MIYLIVMPKFKVICSEKTDNVRALKTAATLVTGKKVRKPTAIESTKKDLY